MGNAFCSVSGVADDVLLGSRSLAEAGVNLAALQVGDNLTFEMTQGPKGYHATNIQQAVHYMPYPQGYPASPQGYTQGSAWGSHEGKRVIGKLKKVHGGNGFCSVDGLADDILLGSRSLQESGVNLQAMQVGDSLSFEIAMGPKGYHAINIGRRVVGTLKKIHGDNGFCSVDGVADDVLLGSRSLKECDINLQAMQVGESLSFEIAMGPKGYHAINIGKRVAGTLKKIHGDKGFCSVDGVSHDVLLGSRSLSECGISLQEIQLGDNLTFELAMGPKGYHAINIQREA